MVEFFCAGLLETSDLDPLGVHPGHHVLDRTVTLPAASSACRIIGRAIRILGVQTCPVASCRHLDPLCEGLSPVSSFFTEITRVIPGS